MHNHSDGWLLKTPHLVPKTMQGFTTEVLMADGISYAPVNAHAAREWVYYLRALDGLRVDEYRGWRSIAEFMRRIEGRNVQNAAAHIPYANVRALACGWGRRRASTTSRCEAFKMRFARPWTRVPWGFPQAWITSCSRFRRRTSLSKPAPRRRSSTVCTSPTFATRRDCSPRCRKPSKSAGAWRAGAYLASQAAVGPTIRGSSGVHRSDRASRSLVLVRPVSVSARVDNAELSAPVRSLGAGPARRIALDRRCTDARRCCGQRLEAFAFPLEQARIAWVAGKENTRHQGKRLSEYVQETGLPAAEAITDLLIEERLGVLMVVGEGDDELMRPFLAHELAMVGTDAIYTDDGPVHPRMYGTSGRILGQYVRDLKIFSLEDAVYKLCGFPARRFGLADRGVIREGGFADVVVFNPETIADRTTFEKPRQLTIGIDDVLVNGAAIVSGGAPVEKLSSPLPGRYVRHCAGLTLFEQGQPPDAASRRVVGAAVAEI